MRGKPPSRNRIRCLCAIAVRMSRSVSASMFALARHNAPQPAGNPRIHPMRSNQVCGCETICLFA